MLRLLVTMAIFLYVTAGAIANDRETNKEIQLRLIRTSPQKHRFHCSTREELKEQCKRFLTSHWSQDEYFISIRCQPNLDCGSTTIPPGRYRMSIDTGSGEPDNLSDVHLMPEDIITKRIGSYKLQMAAMSTNHEKIGVCESSPPSGWYSYEGAKLSNAWLSLPKGTVESYFLSSVPSPTKDVTFQYLAELICKTNPEMSLGELLAKTHYVSVTPAPDVNTWDCAISTLTWECREGQSKLQASFRTGGKNKSIMYKSRFPTCDRTILEQDIWQQLCLAGSKVLKEEIHKRILAKKSDL